ncbi:interferon-inducible GTPase 1-like isoform X1 [Apodemus sylvaticus]|uniref:interferon-inducible GTPase 1-like isoform X1 n=1 Tax=Apodemus sylvaticus TaxID=10129 RepID=UPI002243FAB2|nr:interferon-inducible GTPase 1-like isoform X1 [Apodemus sylvaticus]XP_052011906.1 interferon-inducible GTPase 1-like isoform X1 [Apodemus sylvaticus]XP_052011907.1 interferon-inducible GTPase 1-like isoform X1 [Apodemus sylvaticus]
MGQLFSSPKNEHQDLASSFTEYFKKFKTGNKIISQEIITSVELSMTKGNIQGANSAIRDALKEIDSTPLNVAVTGESGSGKSSFINALRGIGHEEKGAAETGVVETTMERQPYNHPNMPNVVFWDLPGIGTTNFPPKTYLEKMKFYEYDFFIIISATRFKKNDIDLAKAISMMKKEFYFVRTKVDSDLRNEEECKPRTFDREKVLQDIRFNCVKNFRENDMNEPPIFLISNRNFSDYDFPIMMDKLISDLPVYKRHNFMLSLPNITDSAIEKKQQFLKQKIWLEAFAADLLSIIPSLTFILDSDLEILEKSMKSYRTVFGVDDESLQSLAMDWKMPMDQVEDMLKSPKVFKLTDEETVQERLSRYYKEYCLANGYLVSKNLYLREIFYLKFYFLDMVTKDSKTLLKEICLRNKLVPN